MWGAARVLAISSGGEAKILKIFTKHIRSVRQGGKYPLAAASGLANIGS
jgi:hypothetical protein